MSGPQSRFEHWRRENSLKVSNSEKFLRVILYMRWIFSNLPNPSSRTMALGSTQPLTEMVPGILKKKPGGKVRQARRADNLAAIS
jgi:hypothetical protein